MLAVEQAKRLARRARTCSSSASTARSRDHLREREEKSGVDVPDLPRPLRAAGEAGRGRAPELPGGRGAARVLRTRSCRYALVEAIEELGPQYDALFVDEAQDLEQRLARRADAHAPRSGRGPRLAVHGRQPAASMRRELDVPKEFRPFDLTVNCRNTQAIHREVLKKYEGEIEPEVIGPAGREVELIQTDDQAGDGRRRRRAPLRQGGGPAAGRRRPLLPQPRRSRRSARQAARPYYLRRGAQAARPLHPLLLDPRLQGPRVAGRDPLRARGPRRRDDRPAALRRHLAGAEPLRDRGAGRSLHVRSAAPATTKHLCGSTDSTSRSSTRSTTSSTRWR